MGIEFECIVLGLCTVWGEKKKSVEFVNTICDANAQSIISYVNKAP